MLRQVWPGYFCLGLVRPRNERFCQVRSFSVRLGLLISCLARLIRVRSV